MLDIWQLAYTPPSLISPPLKELAAQHGIALGNFAILNHMNDPSYRTILTSQFDFVLADNTPNWYFTDGGLRPSVDAYNFKQMDEVMAYAQTHRMPVEAHHLLWRLLRTCSDLPLWVWMYM